MGKASHSETDKLLAQALMACVETTPVDKVSVKCITEQCGLNRQTFYCHFHDIYDLIRWILEREAYRVVRAAGEAKDLFNCIMLMVQAMDEKRSFFVALYSSSHYLELRQDYMEYLARAQKEEFAHTLCDFGWGSEYADFIARINALILTEFIEKWQKGQSVNTLEQFSKRFSLFLVQQRKGAQGMAAQVRRSQQQG